MGRRTALIVGATGLIGQFVLKEALAREEYERVIVLARRDIHLTHPKLQVILSQFENLADLSIRADDVYCCLGTTIKTAGSREAFRRVDFDFVVQLAQSAHRQGASRMALVSSLGADPQSLFFYLQVKGQVEQQLSYIGFQTLLMFRPSLLLGERTQKRVAEQRSQMFFKKFAFLLPGPFRRYRAIDAQVVAHAMVTQILKTEKGHHIFESDLIAKLASPT